MPFALTAVFAGVPDPRIETANKRHPLTDILVIAGADGWKQVAGYGRPEETFFRRAPRSVGGAGPHRAAGDDRRGFWPAGRGRAHPVRTPLKCACPVMLACVDLLL
jgi:hypothetical protein